MSRNLFAAVSRAVTVTVLSMTGLAAIPPPEMVTAADEASAEIPLTEHDERAIRKFFDEFNVDLATQDRLIGDFVAGEVWDSMRRGAAPVSVESRPIHGVAWTVTTYGDGSVKAEGVGPDLRGSEGAVSPVGVNGCSYSAKAGNYKSCHIYYWVGAVQLGFYADFSIVAGSYNDKITSVWGGSMFAAGACSQSVPSPTIVKKVETATGAAKAGLTAQATMCAINQTMNFPSYLHVGGNKAQHIYS